MSLSQAVNSLSSLPETHPRNGSENETQFTLTCLPSGSLALKKMLNALAPYADLLDLLLEIQSQQGAAAVSVEPQGSFVVDQTWEEDPDLAPPELSEESDRFYVELVESLSTPGATLNQDILLRKLHNLEAGGGEVHLTLRTSLNKTAFLQKLDWPNDLHAVLYLSGEKLLEALSGFNLPCRTCRSLAGIAGPLWTLLPCRLAIPPAG